jgi:hypothetical protein
LHQAFPNPDRFMQDVRGHFGGEQFTKPEVMDAGERLNSHGLIKAMSAAGNPVVRAQVKPSREDVVENYGSSLTAWKSQASGGATEFHTNFNAPVHGQVGIGQSVTQTQQAGFDPATLIALLDDVRESMGEIPPADQAYVGTPTRM